MLLVIDDLQWCDRETLGWLDYLLRRSRGRRCSWWRRRGSRRSDSSIRRSPCSIRAGRGPGHQARAGSAPPERDGDARGNVAGTTWTTGARDGSIARPRAIRCSSSSGCGRDLSTRSPPAGSIPSARCSPRALSVIEARLAQLSPAGQELARLAATVGREFTFDVLMRASSHDEEQVVDALDELWGRRIVRERGVLAYDFSHDKLREVAYYRESSARRRLLHRRVAQALERLHGAHLDDVRRRSSPRTTRKPAGRSGRSASTRARPRSRSESSPTWR